MRHRRRATLCLMLLALSGCTVQLVSRYDAKTEEAATDIHRMIESMLMAAEGEDALPYQNRRPEYPALRIMVRSMRLRAASLPNNDLTVRQIDLLASSVDSLEALDELGLTPEQVPPLRKNFELILGAILRLELAKKRGE